MHVPNPFRFRLVGFAEIKILGDLTPDAHGVKLGIWCCVKAAGLGIGN
jgi:hypothetical protein